MPISVHLTRLPLRSALEGRAVASAAKQGRRGEDITIQDEPVDVRSRVNHGLGHCHWHSALQRSFTLMTLTGALAVECAE